ncbi:hypothetical protein SARC_16359, partial [Sphaeroforma arctica JP610]
MVTSVQTDEEGDLFASADSDSDLDEEEAERKLLTAAREGHTFLVSELLTTDSELNADCK